MARLCERPGCSAPASVAYGFEAASMLVYLDRFDPDTGAGARHGVLCQRHALTLTPPRGWYLVDRRDDRPRLFQVAEPSSAAEDATPPGRPRRARVVDNTEELPLFTDAEAPAPSVGDEQGTSGVGGAWTATFDHRDDLRGQLRARTPLLARAFGFQLR